MVRVGCAYPKWSNDDDERDACCRWWDAFVAPLVERGAVVYGCGPGCAVAMDPSGMYDQCVIRPSGPVWERVLDELESVGVALCTTEGIFIPDELTNVERIHKMSRRNAKFVADLASAEVERRMGNGH